MQIETDGLAARVDDLVDHLERPRDTTVLRVLETKAAAGDTAVSVTSPAMRTCGGAAFSKHTNIERLFRDAHAGVVMAPTGDVLREFIGRAVLGMPLVLSSSGTIAGARGVGLQQRETNHEPNDLGGRGRVRSEGRDDLGGHAPLFS